MELKDIVIEILKERICLIYAFNGVGKTRLSIEYKKFTKEQNGNRHAGVYYNAFSEDLFQWDNDEEHANTGIKLKIIKSNLNAYHSYIIEAPQKLDEYLSRYFVRYKYKLNYNEENYAEEGIESITFYLDDDSSRQIKISRGEERIFVWCFFLALFEVSTITEEQDAHIFIDDPVSSLDEHNIHITASTIMDIIKDNFTKKKLVITTHHAGLFSILLDRLRKSSESERYKKFVQTYILGKSATGELTLSKYGHDVFLMHLYLYKLIRENIDAAKQTNTLQSYNFVLLRQLLENISSFRGKSGSFSFALAGIGIEDNSELINLINEQSHKDIYYYQTGIMSPSQREAFENIVDKIETTYKFHI